MGALLADTTVWIDLLNNRKSKAADLLKSKILDRERVVICPVIIQEVLQGIRDDQIHDLLRDHLLSFELLQLDSLYVALEAARLYRSLRKKGITIRNGVDCTVAVYAMQFDVPLLHSDRDFNLIARHSALKIQTIQS